MNDEAKKLFCKILGHDVVNHVDAHSMIAKCRCCKAVLLISTTEGFLK